MKTPPVQLGHLRVSGLEVGSSQSEKGGGGFLVPLSRFYQTGSNTSGAVGDRSGAPRRSGTYGCKS